MHQRIILISPPLAEKESGFIIWLQKMLLMSYELSLPIVHYGEAKTQEAIKIQMKRKSVKTSITYHQFDDWDDFLILSRRIHSEDIIVLISARRGYVSHMNVLDNLPSKLEKHFEKNSKILIYPQQVTHQNLSEVYDEISSVPISRSIEAFERVGKSLGNLFRKKREE